VAPAALLLLLAAPPVANASPDDPMGQLLVERGLLAARGAVQSLRDKASELVIAAMNFVDVPYRRGGDNAHEGFDCSGFTRHVFALSLGLVLPRRVDEQASAPGLLKVDRNELQPGDLVFFNTLRRTFSHVGIYVGDGKFIHAPRSGAEVRVEDMGKSYWTQRFTGARRSALGGSPVVLEASAERR
jgi:cell wall-associated NlpC family hydrolase